MSITVESRANQQALEQNRRRKQQQAKLLEVLAMYGGVLGKETTRYNEKEQQQGTSAIETYLYPNLIVMRRWMASLDSESSKNLIASIVGHLSNISTPSSLFLPNCEDSGDMIEAMFVAASVGDAGGVGLGHAIAVHKEQSGNASFQGYEESMSWQELASLLEFCHVQRYDHYHRRVFGMYANEEPYLDGVMMDLLREQSRVMLFNHMLSLDENYYLSERRRGIWVDTNAFATPQNIPGLSFQ